MIPFILLVLCALYFLYLTRWAASVLAREYSFGSPSPPVTLPHSVGLSIMVSVIWGFLLLAGAFWGFTWNRYPEIMSIRGSAAEVVLLVVLCISVGLSQFVVYRLGEMAGVANMKSTHLFQTVMHNKDSQSGDEGI